MLQSDWLLPTSGNMFPLHWPPYYASPTPGFSHLKTFVLGLPLCLPIFTSLILPCHSVIPQGLRILLQVLVDKKRERQSMMDSMGGLTGLAWVHIPLDRTLPHATRKYRGSWGKLSICEPRRKTETA